MRGLRIVTAVAETSGRSTVQSQDDHHILKRLSGRGRYSPPKRDAIVAPERRLVRTRPGYGRAQPGGTDR
jgi:hypothetical protein